MDSPVLVPEAFPTAIPESLDEDELRKQYEDSEIKRFLHIFSTYVIEVRSSELPEGTLNKSSDSVSELGTLSSSQEDDFVLVAGAPSISDYVANHIVVPLLPLRVHEVGPFSISRTRLTLSRLYIVAQIHLPHLRAIGDLALWTNYENSLVGCIIFWVLWWYNFLLPAALGCMLYGVARRGLLPYPTVQDLREHHSRVLQADNFSATLSSRISRTSTLDLKEIWRLLKIARMDWVSKFTVAQKEKEKDLTNGDTPSASQQLNGEGEGDRRTAMPPDDVIFDDTGDLSLINDIPNFKRYLLHILTEFVDLHERLRNIAIWRNRSASQRYTLLLLVGFFATSLVPAQYIAKATYAAIGIVYWHCIPLLCAMSSLDRKRIPAPFEDAPTDAEYAMKLISERIASGEDVQTLLHAQTPPFEPDDPHKLPESDRMPATPPKTPSKLKAIGKVIAEESNRLAHGHAPALAAHPLWNGALSVLSPDLNPGIYTYTAQRGSNPGLITLMEKRLLFTPFVSSNLKMDIDVNDITRVKKTSMLRGLKVSYMNPETGNETEEKYHWINGRDELFARLIGLGHQRWQNI